MQVAHLVKKIARRALLKEQERRTRTSLQNGKLCRR